jgi:hypothetical protein
MSSMARPTARQQAPVRPLVRGMFLDRAGQHIEDGGFVRIINMVARTQGLQRRPGFVETVNGETTTDATNGYDGKQVGTALLWQTGEDQLTLIVTDQMVYSANGSGLTLVPSEIEEQTDWASTDGVTWTTVSGDFIDATSGLSNVAIGDVLEIDGVGSGKIVAINFDTSLDVETALGVSTPYSGETGRVQMSLRLSDRGDKRLPDWAYAYGSMYFTSPNTYVQELFDDSGTWELQRLGASSTPSAIQSQRWSASVIGFFNERMWYGDTYEYDGATMVGYRQRLRYSVAGNPANVTDTAFIDLDYTPGIIQRIIPLGNLLAVYLSDAIYLGQPNNITNLPLTFDQLETGSVGLVGQRAIVPYKDGHFFVGTDNIYYLTTRGLEAIGTPVLTETIRNCSAPWRILATADPDRNRVLFGFPGENDFIERVWSFNYLTSAWTYETYLVDTWMIDTTFFDLSRTIDSMTTGTINTMSTNYASTIDGLASEAITATALIKERDGYIDLAGDVNNADESGNISVTMTSRDHDLGAPEMDKRWSRLSVKVEWLEDVPETVPLDFNVEVSHNRGVTWKNVGTLRIKAGMDEGHCDFRAVSPHLRFRLTNAADVRSYWVTEYTLYWSPSGPEGSLGTQE